MVLRRMAESVRTESWTTLTLELVLLVIGILLAFQLDRAYQAVQDRALERRYLERLYGDLERDVAEVDRVVELTTERSDQVTLLLAAVEDPGVAADRPVEFVLALEKVTWRSVPSITTNTYDELRNTGRSTLLRSESLRNALADYYGRVLEEQRRLGFGEDDQARFRLETLGLLSGEQLSAIEDEERFPLEVSPGEARRIAERFAARTGAHPWLARLTKYQVLMRRLALAYDTRARALMVTIDQELAGP